MKKVLCLLLAVSLLGFIGAFDSARGELLLREGFDNFDSGVRPFGWTFNNCNANSDTYTTEGDYGVSSPSLKMDATDDRATSRTFETCADSKLLFWTKGQGSIGSDSLLVEEYGGGAWGTVVNITTLPASGTTQGPHDLPSDTTQVRFTFTKDTADGVALDDVRVQCGIYLRTWHMSWTSQGQTGYYGNATYYEFPGPDEVLGTSDDKNLLIDGGYQAAAGATVSTLLDDRLSGDPFNNTLYFMALSSPGADNYNGLKMAVDRYNVLNYYENVRWPAGDKTGYDSLIADIDAEGANVYYYDAGDWLSGPSTTVGPAWATFSGWDPKITARVLVANFNAPTAGVSDDNEWAGMLLIKCGETGFLTGGDHTTLQQETWIEDPENTDHSYDGAWNDLTHADFYIVGHHGSTGASSPTFMNRMAPKYVIVEVAHGSGNHPTMEALDACYNAGAITYRTDLDHVVQVRVDDSDNYEITRGQAWSPLTEGNPNYYASSPDINTAPPDLVTGLTVDFANETMVVISWSDGGYDYDVYRSQFSGGDDSAGAATQPGVAYATGIYEKLTAPPIGYATYTDTSWPIKDIAYYYVVASIASTNTGAYYTMQERRGVKEISVYIPITPTPVGYKTSTPTPVSYKTPTPTPTTTLTPVGYKTATPTPTPTPGIFAKPIKTIEIPKNEKLVDVTINFDKDLIIVQTNRYIRIYTISCGESVKDLSLPAISSTGGVYADSYYIYAGAGNWLCRWNNDTTFGESGSSNQGKAISSIYGDGSDYLFAAYTDGNIERFDRADFNTSTVLSNPGSNRYDIFVDSYYVYAADGDKKIYVWNESDLNFVTSFSPQSASNWATESAAMTAVHADDYYLFAGNANANVYEFELGTFDYKTRKDFATETITALFADPLSRYYYASSEDDNVYVYKTDWWDTEAILTDGTDDMLDVCADTERLIGGCSDGTVYFWLVPHTPTPAPTPSPSPITPTPTPAGYKTPIPTPTPVGYKTVTPTPIPSPTPTAEINTPPPTPTPAGYKTPIPTVTPAGYGWVVFNEIAWMGTKYGGYNDEWIELYVNNGSNLDLLGWTISAYDGTPNFTIGSNTTLNTGDYVLFERQDDNTVSDIAADFVYPYANWLHNDGEDLWLKDDGGGVIDHIDMDTFWWAGDDSTYYTMERVRPDWPSDKYYNWATWNGTTQSGKDATGEDLPATADSRNSVWSSSAPTPIPTPTPSNYLDICFNEIAWMGTEAATAHEWIECKNNTGATINMKGFRVYTKSGNVDFTVLSDVNILAGNYYIFEEVTDYVVRDVTGYVYSDTGYLSNAGERLILTSNGVIWDDIDYADAWPAGVADPVIYTMEKVNSTADGNAAANWANNDGDPIVGRDANDVPINGTAKAGNSVPRRALRAPATGILQLDLYPKDRYYPAPSEELPTPPPAPEEADLVRVDSADYDGDGIADVAIFRPDTGLWVIRDLSRFYFGESSDLPVSGDYDGDGSADVAIYRSGLWAIKDLSRVYFGAEGDIPMPGDYTGDGAADIAIFRTATGLWAVKGLTKLYFGIQSDQAVPGDYDGDGAADIAIFRSSTGLWKIKDITLFYLGTEGDIAVPGDYDGSGLWTAGIFRPASGLWAIRGFTRLYFGEEGDQLLPGDYDGDLVDDIAIFRPSAGLWAVRDLTRLYLDE